MFEFITDEEERGQVGIGTLIVFIAMVLVAAIAAGVLINTAGFLQGKAEATGQDATAEVTNGVDAVSVVGIEGDANDIEEVRVTVKKRAGSDAINVSSSLVQYFGPSLSADLTYDNDGMLDDTDEFQTVDALGGSNAQVLEDSDDRITISLTLDNNDATGGGSLSAGDQPLSAGEEATLTIVSASGTQSEVTLNVPNTLTDGEGSAHQL